MPLLVHSEWYYQVSTRYNPPQEFGPFGSTMMRSWRATPGFFADREDLMVRLRHWPACFPLKEIYRGVANDAFVKPPQKPSIWGPCKGNLDGIPEREAWLPMSRHQRKKARDEYRQYAIDGGYPEEDSVSDDTPLSSPHRRPTAQMATRP